MQKTFKHCICFTFIVLSHSLFANDSLKVKKIEYFENGNLSIVDNYDTLDRVISRYSFTPLPTKINHERCNVTVNKYLRNTPIIASQTIYSFITSVDSTYFDGEFIGYKSVSAFDSTSMVLKFSLQNMEWDRKNKANNFSMDSLFNLKIKFKKVKDNQKVLYKYDKDFNLIYHKKRIMGGGYYVVNITYDSKKRSVSWYSENAFDEFIPNVGVRQVKEKTITKTKYVDENRTSERIIETFREKRLYTKSFFKTYYNEDGKELLNEEYVCKIEKGEQIGEPKLISRRASIYENKFKIKIIDEDFKIPKKQTQELKYTFW